MKLNLLEMLKIEGVANMFIDRIRVCGFKNITEQTLNFGDITALVGLNGYGKSNVIDAIGFGFDFIHAPMPVKENLMTSKKCIPILKANAGRDFSFEIEFRMESNGTPLSVQYGYSFAWETNQSPARIRAEFLKIRKDEKGQRYNAFISRTESGAYFRTSETGRCDKSVKIEPHGLIVNKLIALDDLFYLDAIKQINALKFFIERHLDANPSFMPAPFVIKGFQELELEGIQSIPRAIFYLKKDFPDKFELLLDAFMQLFPDVKELHIEEIKLDQGIGLKQPEDFPLVFSDSIYVMSIVDDRLIQPVRFEDLSDGTKRVFLMLTFAIIADIKKLSMIAIEEPENSIHPSLFQSYLDVLSQLVSGCRIMFTSHSPYIIQYLNPERIYVGMTQQSGETSFRKIASTKVKKLLRDAAEYNHSTGDYLFDLLSSAESNEYLQEYVDINGK